MGQVQDDGTYKVFADNARLVSTVGLNLDTDGSRNRLLVAVSDPGYNLARTSAGTWASWPAWPFSTAAAPKQRPRCSTWAAWARPPATPATSPTTSPWTRTATPTSPTASRRLSTASRPAGYVSVFADNAQFAAPAGAFGLNGIVYHPDGYLLVAKSNTGTLFKIPLATPAAFSTVDVGAQNLTAADGLRLADNNTLQVVCNAQAKVYRLATTNGWASAAVTGAFSTPPQYPTTLAYRRGYDGGDNTYVLYSNLNALQAMQSPPVSVFTIAKVKF